jgi:hypothetical protein
MIHITDVSSVSIQRETVPVQVLKSRRNAGREEPLLNREKEMLGIYYRTE